MALSVTENLWSAPWAPHGEGVRKRDAQARRGDFTALDVAPLCLCGKSQLLFLHNGFHCGPWPRPPRPVSPTTASPKDGNLTHVTGFRGGMWLTVKKNKTHILPKYTTIYLAYEDASTAPALWEITDVTCPEGPQPPAGAIGLQTSHPNATSNVSNCYWLQELNRTSSLEQMLEFELTGSGLAENRDESAYVAQLSYALVYPRTASQDYRREEFTVPIYTRVVRAPPAGGAARPQPAQPGRLRLWQGDGACDHRHHARR